MDLALPSSLPPKVVLGFLELLQQSPRNPKTPTPKMEAWPRTPAAAPQGGLWRRGPGRAGGAKQARQQRLQKPNPEGGDGQPLPTPRKRPGARSLGRLADPAHPKDPARLSRCVLAHEPCKPPGGGGVGAGAPGWEEASGRPPRPARPLSAEGRPEPRRGGGYPRPGSVPPARPWLPSASAARLRDMGLARPGRKRTRRRRLRRPRAVSGGAGRGSLASGGFGAPRRARLGGRAPRGLCGAGKAAEAEGATAAGSFLLFLHG